MSYEPRFYRSWSKDTDLVSFQVVDKQTDLYIRASANLERKAKKVVAKYREMIGKYIEKNPVFVTTLEPFPFDNKAPVIIQKMVEWTTKVRVGPMASIAGTIAEFVGNELLEYSDEIIVENGGDIFLKTSKQRLIGIYAGDSPLSGKLALEINPQDTPCGVCTSSGTVGPSLSFGTADAVVIVSPSAGFADAVATAVGNRVKTVDDIPQTIEFAQQIDGLSGVVIIKGDKLGVWGKVKLVPIKAL